MSKHEALEKAIAAHAAWKGKFRSFMRGESDLDSATVEKCNACDFGKWLEGEGRAALGPSHGEVHRAHASFHMVAASVVRKKKSGDIEGAEVSLSVTGEFTKASTSLTMLIVSVRDGVWRAA